jgi:hypothetical protein
MKRSANDKGTGKVHEMTGEAKEKVGQVTNDPNLEGAPDLRRSERRQNRTATLIERRRGYERRTAHRAALFDDFTTP